MDEGLRSLLEDLYILLRGLGYSYQSEIIKKLLYYVETNDVEKFKKTFKSSTIWGGAGSIKDIALQNDEMQRKLSGYITKLKLLGSKI
jgi:hypothetical protein